MENPTEVYTFDFKIAYFERKFELNFKPDNIIKKFVEDVTYSVRQIHPTDRHTIEIVEAGQYNNINGKSAELAPEISYSEADTLKDIYGKNGKITAFYIRLKPNHETSNST